MIASAWGRWTRSWFPPVPLERLALFRLAATSVVLVDVVVHAGSVGRSLTIDRAFLDPVALVRVVELLGLDPIPSRGAHLAGTVLLVVALAAGVLGYRTRWALGVAAPLYLYHWALRSSWGTIEHAQTPLVLALIVLAVAPSGMCWSLDALQRARRRRANPRTEPRVTGRELDPLAGWALRIVAVGVVLTYLLTLVAALRGTEAAWPGPIQTFVWFAYASAPLALTGGTRRNVVLGMLGALHLVDHTLFATPFAGFAVGYLAFFELERWIPQRQGLRMAPLRADRSHTHHHRQHAR